MITQTQRLQVILEDAARHDRTTALLTHELCELSRRLDLLERLKPGPEMPPKSPQTPSQAS